MSSSDNVLGNVASVALSLSPAASVETPLERGPHTHSAVMTPRKTASSQYRRRSNVIALSSMGVSSANVLSVARNSMTTDVRVGDVQTWEIMTPVLISSGNQMEELVFPYWYFPIGTMKGEPSTRTSSPST
eukprot:scaffold946_cov415-Prasinococcus_capsulatus_cf.AAC.3